MRRLGLVLLLLLLVVAACGGDGGGEPVRAAGSSTSSASTTAVDRDAEYAAPPPIVVSGGGRTLELDPWTYCWSSDGHGVCADGDRPAVIPDLGAADEVTVEFPVEGWSFSASVRESDDACTRDERVELEPVGATTFRLVPQGGAGTHLVDVDGRGPGGDVIVSFTWTTPVDGPFTAPASSTSIIADHDGVPDSYGVELGADHLATKPAVATATVVVTAAGGESTKIELARTDGECEPAAVRFAGPIEDGVAAARSGEPPFTYDVTMTLDGVVHEAHATWPDDEVESCRPCVPLTWDPPLPAKTAP